MFDEKNPNTIQPIIQASDYNNGIIYRVCPSCGLEKPIEAFGFRKMEDGTIRNQSWCKDCRAQS